MFVDATAKGIDTDAVVADNHGGARKAVDHLLRHGHRRIALLAESTRLDVAQERLAGYQDSLTRAGVAVDSELVHLDLRTTSDARVAATTVMSMPEERRPTAIFTASNRITIGTLEALQDLHEGVALVGFGDFETAGLLSPGVTVVRHDPAEMAKIAARLLLERLTGARTAPPSTVRIPVELIRRGSGELPPPLPPTHP